MKNTKVRKIDFSAERLGLQADKYYNEGKYFSALRFAYRQYETYGGDEEVYARLADIYEGMRLHASAINWWFRFLDIAKDEDLPDVYEGIAVNYLNMGNEAHSAYYYNKLIDADASLPEETKLDIAEAFSKNKSERFRFVYPPELADFSKEIDYGSHALKAGDCKGAIRALSVVEKGAKDYARAKEMQAVAYLLSGDDAQAESICKELLADYPENVRILSTLSAVYMEQDRKEESKEIALKLVTMEQENADDLYKVATVCCENGLHEEAYKKFLRLEEQSPFDGRMTYFKAVSAYHSGKYEEAERALETLCTVYPDAEVGKYYLRALRNRENKDERLAEAEEPSYFYHLPQREREERCRILIHINESAKDEAQLFGEIALQDGYFRWCFDEMDGADKDLQYLALTTAVRARLDDFICEVLLNCEVDDVLKVETLRMLCERNEDIQIGVVLCHIYRKVFMPSIRVGRKRRKKFIESYATVCSKFAVINDGYARKIQQSAERLYSALEKNGGSDLIESAEDCACAIFLSSGLKELGNNPETVISAFHANAEKVHAITNVAFAENQETSKENTEQNTIETYGEAER